MIAIDLSIESCVHLVRAIKDHEKALARNGAQIPEQLTELAAACAKRPEAARRGQREPSLAEVAESIDAGTVSPRLVTTDTAAAVLSVSSRSLRRILADPTSGLAAVHLPGGPRIRITDLDAYVARLTTRSTNTPTADGAT